MKIGFYFSGLKKQNNTQQNLEELSGVSGLIAYSTISKRLGFFLSLNFFRVVLGSQQT